jgi:hypothetical protein
MRNLICFIFSLVMFCATMTTNAQKVFDADSALRAIISDAESSMEYKTTACFKLDSLVVAENIPDMRGDIYARLGGLNFNVNPKQAIAYYKTAITFYKLEGNKPWTGFSYLNTGSVFDEKLHIYDSAVYYVNLSYQKWIEVGDTTQMANVLKYLGLLKAKAGHPEEGKKDVILSVALFKNSKFPQGVAVAYFDLAGIWDIQNNSDSALYYYGISKDMQIAKADTFRIVTINNKMLEVYIKLKDFNACKKIIQECEALNPENFYWLMQLAFYKDCVDYYTLIKDEPNLLQYQKKLEALKESLRSEGIQFE